MPPKAKLMGANTLFHQSKFGKKANLYLLHFHELSWILSIVNYFLARSSFLAGCDIDQPLSLKPLSAKAN